MLSIGKLAPGQENYYLSAVAQGVDDYYLGSGEVPGRWLGGGAGDLGLEGQVSAEDLHAVLSGLDPGSGAALGRANRKLPGFDATFSAPKSVSLLFALGDERVSAAAVAAHDAAVDAALGYLERQAAVVRRGHNGTERMESSGFVAAAFRHRTSRAGDPQLHTHVLVANAAHGLDGRWGALDARLLYLHRMAAGFAYQAQLRAELTRSLGVRWRAVSKGTAEIEGIPTSVLRAFSQRRVEIEARLGELGLSGARAAEVAALDTRAAKDYGVDAASLSSDWHRRAQALGFGAERLGQVLDVGRQPQRMRVRPAVLGEELTANRSSFDRRHVIEALATAACEGAEVASLETMADRFLATEAAVALSEGRAGMRYSTPELLKIEGYVLAGALRHRHDGLGVVDERAVESVLAARPSLADEQREMVRALTRSGAGVDVVVGAAGTGKTTALDAARAAWATSGHHVVGACLAARAAAELEAGSGIPSVTLASLLTNLNRGVRLPPKAVVVVDEAAMVGTRQLYALMTHARAAKAKVVLVGDHHQLPEIEAGGVFRSLVKRLDAVVLRANRRQRDAVERKAVADLRAGKVGEAVAALDAHGRIRQAASAESLRWSMVADWWEVRQSGADVVMLAMGRAEVEALNRAARAVLDDAGLLGAERLAVGSREFAVGDEVMATRNWRSIGVLNGTRGRVVAFSEDGSLTLALDARKRGRRLELPASYVAAGHVVHGYASTVYKAQGRTCDIALVWGDERLYAEAGYTALTRGRDENRIYVLAGDEDVEHVGSALPDPVDELVRSLRSSRADELGIELRQAAGMSIA